MMLKRVMSTRHEVNFEEIIYFLPKCGFACFRLPTRFFASPVDLIRLDILSPILFEVVSRVSDGFLKVSRCTERDIFLTVGNPKSGTKTWGAAEIGSSSLPVSIKRSCNSRDPYSRSFEEAGKYRNLSNSACNK